MAAPLVFYDPEGIYRTPSYHNAVRAGDFLFVAGQIGKDSDGNLVEPGNALAQAQVALDNLKAVLASAGATFGDVVKLTTILTDRADGPAVSALRRATFGEHRPPHTGMIIAGLGTEGAKVEFEAIAYLPAGNPLKE